MRGACFVNPVGTSPRTCRHVVRPCRGDRHAGVVCGPVTLMFGWPVRAYLSHGSRWRCEWVGGCLYLRLGPMGVTWFRRDAGRGSRLPDGVP